MLPWNPKISLMGEGTSSLACGDMTRTLHSATHRGSGRRDPHSPRDLVKKHRAGRQVMAESKKEVKSTRNWPIYLYVPNLIGYARVIANIVAFTLCFSNKRVFAWLYLISFICDELDGRFARMLDQRSTFGAVLDMVTDRVSTAALLVVLSQLYSKFFLLFLGLLALDIASHWLQMYSTFLASKTSHKDVGDSSSFLLRAYYQHRLFMGYCCVGAEVVYLVLFLVATDSSANVFQVVWDGVSRRSPLVLVGLVALPGCVIKQFVNVVQMKNAADICVLYDLQKREAKTS